MSGVCACVQIESDPSKAQFQCQLPNTVVFLKNGRTAGFLPQRRQRLQGTTKRTLKEGLSGSDETVDVDAVRVGDYAVLHADIVCRDQACRLSHPLDAVDDVTHQPVVQQVRPQGGIEQSYDILREGSFPLRTAFFVCLLGRAHAEDADYVQVVLLQLNTLDGHPPVVEILSELRLRQGREGLADDLDALLQLLAQGRPVDARLQEDVVLLLVAAQNDLADVELLLDIRLQLLHVCEVLRIGNHDERREGSLEWEVGSLPGNPGKLDYLLHRGDLALDDLVEQRLVDGRVRNEVHTSGVLEVGKAIFKVRLEKTVDMFSNERRERRQGSDQCEDHFTECVQGCLCVLEPETSGALQSSTVKTNVPIRYAVDDAKEARHDRVEAVS